MSLKNFLCNILSEMNNQPDLHNITGFSEKIKHLQNRLNDDFFRIAVVGEFSSGKSTFINALIGKDILSHATTETTATLSRLINVSEDDERNGQAYVHMKDGSIKIIDDLSEIKEFTTTKSSSYKVAEEVNFVELYVPILKTNQSIAIVDTPGLNGMAKGHLEQTINIVQEAHACIYLLQRRGMTETDIKFLNEFLVPYQQNFIFVQNFIDEFNEQEDEYIDQRIDEIKNTLKDKVFKDKDSQYFYEVCGLSALQELSGRDENIKRVYATDTTDLTTEARQECLQKSGFNKLRQILHDNFNDTELDTLKFVGIIEPLINWCEELLQNINRRQQEMDEIYKNSHEYKSKEKAENLRDMVLRAKSSDSEALKGFISRQCSELQKQLQEELNNKLDIIQKNLKSPVNDFKHISDLENYSKNLNNRIQSEIFEKQTELYNYCNLKLKSIYQLIKERIESYSGISQSSLYVQQWSINFSKPIQTFDSRNDIQKINNNIYEFENDKKLQQNELSKNKNDIDNAKNHLIMLNNQIRNVQQQRSRLGSRPQPIIYKEAYEVEVEKSFLIFFSRTETETRYRDKKDDSAGQNWDMQMSSINNQENEIRAQIHAAERRLQTLKEDEEYNQHRINNIEQKIESLKYSLKIETDRVNAAKTMAAAKYLSECKQRLRNQLDKYFEDVKHKLMDEWSKLIDKGKNDLQKRALQYFEENFKQKLTNIDMNIHVDDDVIKQKLNSISNAKTLIKDIVNKLQMKASEIL